MTCEEIVDRINEAYDETANSLLDSAQTTLALREGLSWALDMLDMYDARLESIDGVGCVYTPAHVAAKAKARAALVACAARADLC